jgi:UDP-N-acetylmuramate dehydrogenase
MLQHNVSLLPYNTFGIDANAANFVVVTNENELQQAIFSRITPILVLGGGSNMLLTKDIQGLVIKNEIKGIHVVREFKNKVWVEVGGGVVWHDFVLWALANNFGGIENLSLIPGTVGASPIQNIGAYGVELKDVLVKVRALHLFSAKRWLFSTPNCQFGYRDSIFKHPQYAGYFCITKVIFSLTKEKHTLHLEYGAIKDTLAKQNIAVPTIQDISNAVIAIRKSKLPDPAILGNAGSFFKNPELPRAQYDLLQTQHPTMPHYDLPDGSVKVPAGWLIEQCGWKGKRVGNTGAHAQQALVLVNYGGATGEEIKNMANRIIASVQEKFGIALSAEVNMF